MLLEKQLGTFCAIMFIFSCSIALFQNFIFNMVNKIEHITFRINCTLQIFSLFNFTGSFFWSYVADKRRNHNQIFLINTFIYGLLMIILLMMQSIKGRFLQILVIVCLTVCREFTLGGFQPVLYALVLNYLARKGHDQSNIGFVNIFYNFGTAFSMFISYVILKLNLVENTMVFNLILYAIFTSIISVLLLFVAPKYEDFVVETRKEKFDVCESQELVENYEVAEKMEEKKEEKIEEKMEEKIEENHESRVESQKLTKSHVESQKLTKSQELAKSQELMESQELEKNNSQEPVEENILNLFKRPSMVLLYLTLTVSGIYKFITSNFVAALLQISDKKEETIKMLFAVRYLVEACTFFFLTKVNISYFILFNFSILTSAVSLFIDLNSKFDIKALVMGEICKGFGRSVLVFSSILIFRSYATNKTMTQAQGLRNSAYNGFSCVILGVCSYFLIPADLEDPSKLIIGKDIMRTRMIEFFFFSYKIVFYLLLFSLIPGALVKYLHGKNR